MTSFGNEYFFIKLKYTCLQNCKHWRGKVLFSSCLLFCLKLNYNNILYLYRIAQLVILTSLHCGPVVNIYTDIMCRNVGKYIYTYKYIHTYTHSNTHIYIHIHTYIEYIHAILLVLAKTFELVARALINITQVNRI